MCELIFFKNFTHIPFSNTPTRSQVLPMLPMLSPTTVATLERNKPKEYETQNFLPNPQSMFSMFSVFSILFRKTWKT